MPLTRETRYIEAIAPVSGNSMYPEIHDGALVFIRPAKDFKDGDKLIVFLKESAELTLKYAFKVPPPKNNPQTPTEDGFHFRDSPTAQEKSMSTGM